MGDTLAKIEEYDNMITDLNTFCTNVSSSCAVILTAVNVCTDAMGGDKASLIAAKKVALSVAKMEEAIEIAKKLSTALEEEKQNLINYVAILESMQND